MARTLVVDPQKLEDAMAQIASGADKITIGGKTYSKNSSVVNRIKTRPQTVRSLLADESPLQGGVPKMPQAQPITTGTQNIQQINLPSDFRSNLVLTLQNVLRERFAQKGNLGLQAQGKAAFEGLATLPETTAATPGFLGLDLSQARRLQDIEGAGLGNLVSGVNTALGQRESRIQQLGELAGQAFGEQRELEAAEADRLAQMLENQQKTVRENTGLESSLRKEFQASAKDFETVRDSFSRIIAASSEGTSTGDIALIFNFMKMLDPNSVVRESEFATAENAGTIPQALRGLYNKLLSGEGRLDASLRDQYVQTANSLFDKQKGQHSKRIDEFTRIAESSGLNPENVILDLSLAGDQVAKASSTQQKSSIFKAKGMDGKIYSYDLTNPAHVAELEQGRSIGFFTN